ncbi:flagellar protein FlgN [Robertmurraya massiliosenegalensis]|uniref:flagellar protein FlgN n=1 Tax=Robertmurraya massiliosenegalensis TaxID=1287657 RepID=UPI0002DE5A67|nr:flagellar protein FlgN [Robertmurraya massiliosenegalensis]
MSAERLFKLMEQLLKLHKSLLGIAVKKTDIIKKSDIEPLELVLKEEQKHIAAIRKIEEEREKSTSALFPNLDSPTIKDCIEVMDGTEKQRLTEVANNLNNVLKELKEQNHLNQQLIQQSLHFVNVTLNLFTPQPESINYSPPKGNIKTNVKIDRFFNSKA